MAIIAKNKFIVEDIVNEKGAKIGEIKFNPNDSMIMKALSEIIGNLSSSINKLKNYKDIDLKNLDENSTIEDFENVSDELKKAEEAINLEYEVIKSCIESLKKVFGNECIECFTQDTLDIDALIPLIDFIDPYIKKNRTSKVNQYIKNSKKDSEVFE